ncbi:nickel ABC transporter permease [Priestia koreensis]|uniref:nickel ABC transporter permease n=1 Tax=Priestia koreensis TaxID=284581 RepID=UPI003457BEF2
MMRFCLERLSQLIIVILFVSTATFLLVRFAPGDPAHILLAKNNVPVSQEALRHVRQELGLTDSLWEQYIKWIKGVFTGQWGVSFSSKEPVMTELLTRLPATLELAGAGFIVMVSLTFFIAIGTTVYTAKWVNAWGKMLALFGASIPGFWLGFLLIYVFSVRYGWLPSMGHGTILHLILPAITLGGGVGAIYARVLRANMLEMMKQPFVKASKARGMSQREIMTSQLLKHAFSPILAIFGTNFAFMLGGSVIVETVFSWPGLGKYVIESIGRRDYPVIQGYVILTSFIFVSIHMIVDIVNRWLDPRLRIY